MTYIVIVWETGSNDTPISNNLHPRERNQEKNKEYYPSLNLNLKSKHMSNQVAIPPLTISDVRMAVPASVKNSITQEVVDSLNNISSDPLIAEQVRSNFIQFSHVLTEGKHSIQDYINASHYASYVLMGMKKQDAYFKTFPDRYARLMAEGRSAKEMSAYASMYAKNKIVEAILEKALIPAWIFNQDIFQRAVNVQASLMMTAQSEKVRQEAANSLLTHLAKPKEAAAKNQVNVQINNHGSNITDKLYEAVAKLANQQQYNIRGGTSVSDAVDVNIIDMEEDNGSSD